MKHLKDLGSAASIVRHAITVVVVLATGVIVTTRLYDQIQAMDVTVDANKENIEEIKGSLNKLSTQQQIIIKEIDSEKERSKDFRDRTDRSLDRILDKLVPGSRRPEE